MNSQEFLKLQEAYLEVVENQQQLDEGYKPLPTDRIKKKASRLAKDTLRDAGTALNPFKSASEKSAAKSNMAKRQKRVDKMVDVMKKETQKEEVDIYDIILSHLLDEGYAETLESAEAIMVNMSEDWREDIMEISQKTATSAYANSKTGEFEGQDSPRDVERTDNLRRQIKRKFGDKAAKHADRAAHARTFGRKGAGGMPPKP